MQYMGLSIFISAGINQTDQKKKSVLRSENLLMSSCLTWLSPISTASSFRSEKMYDSLLILLLLGFFVFKVETNRLYKMLFSQNNEVIPTLPHSVIQLPNLFVFHIQSQRGLPMCLLRVYV